MYQLQNGHADPMVGMSGVIDPDVVTSSLSDLGLIYCGGGKLVHFSDPHVDKYGSNSYGYSLQTIEKLSSISHSPRYDHPSPTGC
jgi:hypothetical protein